MRIKIDNQAGKAVLLAAFRPPHGLGLGREFFLNNLDMPT